MSDLDRKLEQWTEAGLITADQARAIRAAETREGNSSIPALAEVLAYAGAIFALSAVVFIASRVWSDLPVGLHLGVLALLTGVLWAGGWLLRSSRNPGRNRLVGVLWFLSVGGVGWLADVIATDWWELKDGYGLIIGLAVFLYAGLLYRDRRASLQLIAMATGVGFLCGGLSDLAGGDDWFGLLLWITGVAWIALARLRMLTPQRTGFALGAVGVLGGAQMVAIEFFDTPNGWGLALGLVSAAALLYLSVSYAQVVLLGFGIAGLFIFLVQVIGEYLADSIGGPLALLAVGMVLLVLALVAIRLKERTRRTGLTAARPHGGASG